MPIERAKQEIDDGIASTKAALGDNADALAPFFRIPGLLRADNVEDYLAEQGIQVWSADFLADDWRHISSCARLRSRDQPARGQGKRHSAAPRYPGAHRCRLAADSRNVESARLSHRPCGARDRQTGPQRRPNRKNGCCIPRRTRSPTGRRFRILSSPISAAFLSRRVRTSKRQRRRPRCTRRHYPVHPGPSRPRSHRKTQPLPSPHRRRACSSSKAALTSPVRGAALSHRARAVASIAHEAGHQEAFAT